MKKLTKTETKILNFIESNRLEEKQVSRGILLVKFGETRGENALNNLINKNIVKIIRIKDSFFVVKI